MRLARTFYRLPVQFDVERLQAEVAALPAAAWVAHPNGIRGNSALRLISVGGGPNDDVDGVMQPTAELLGAPYLRQVLASFGVVWSRSRLMRLAPQAEVPEHADINYHWHYRVRVHIPVTTRPEVMFHCGGDAVHMQAGEAWIFDSWRQHRVTNGSGQERIHLVADTSGNAGFWQRVAQGSAGALRPHRYDPALDGVMPLTERTALAPVMNPGEIELLVLDLRAELAPAAAAPAEAQQRLTGYHALLDAFCRDWRQTYALYGETAEGWERYAALRQRLREASLALADALVTRTNQVAVHKVLEGRLLRAILPAVADAQGPRAAQRSRLPSAPAPRPPVFIIAAPRSGSTLLFETLCASSQVSSLGGEGHWLIEDLPHLRPGAGGVDSNRLTALQADAAAAAHIRAMIRARSVDADGAPAAPDASLQFIEKTPKNALRIPFLQRVFPDARFVFLWRDPRENLSSIIEAWRSGRWKTYNGLEGFDGPWSLLLPPGWQAMNGRPLEEIAAFQWDAANRTALDDLQQLPRPQWTLLRYADLVATPRVAIERLCAFLDLPLDARLAARVDAPLPNSRFTLTPPASDKWRANAAAIERVLPSIAITWRRLEALGDAGPAGA
jgi:hypothetical protein